VFSTWSGKPISPNNVLRRWIVRLRHVGTEAREPADAVTNLLVLGPREGCAGKVIAQLMGHAKVDTTLNVYTQVGSELFSIVHKPEEARGANSESSGAPCRTRTCDLLVRRLMQVPGLVGSSWL
jgi:hypothetical protein